MSEINANIVVEPITLAVTQTPITQTVTVAPIDLSIFTAAPSSNPPGGTVGQLQYNAGSNVFGGLANANVDGGTLTFSNLANLKIDGGTNAYYLQTDGAGALTWAAGGTPTGSGVPSGANTLIQLSDGSGSFASGAGFSFDNVSNVFSAPGNIDASGIFNGDGGGLSNIASANVTGLGNIATINLDGNAANYLGGTGVWGSVGGIQAQIANGTSNVRIATVDGNIDFAVAGSDVARMSTTGAPYPAFFKVEGNIVAENNILTSETLVGNGLTVTGTSSIEEAIEKVTVNAGGATGTINYDILSGAIVYYAGNATGSFVLNLRGNGSTTLNTVMAIGESMTFSFMNTNSGLVYYLTGLEIDGTARIINWIDGTAPTTGTSNAIDNYSFNVIKTASDTYTVLGAVGAYY